MQSYSPSEIYQFAVKIEENGKIAYEYFEKKFSDPKLKKIFNFLASEEVKHKETFEKILTKIEDYSSGYYDDQYFLYIRAFADNVIFTKEKFEKEIDKITDALSALDFAMKKELDTINYYYALKAFVKEDKQNLIDDIIKQERNHFLTLSKIKENYE
ncbi:MAG: hypothetical protein A2086_02675 [Spirochaetes bacterium GWD1_27_9]|nr:MAG: hypothetical protein A2Z98_14560 [Spirochaetes bacterium GWB1_27_13]OHD26774.1 MAG: hypothetical protein A2Y34_02980 [Spirochaetes bacterium GWC1_27_15]OHD31531.1 MAG: hypothetical protein A2086_02675 [Spirochaetes bacterium GWD1_27_9]